MNHSYKESITTANGRVIYRHYEVISFLGGGSFGNAWKVMRKQDKKIFALKVIEKIRLSQSQHKIKLNRQIQIHQRLNHPNICQFHLVFEDSDAICLLLEFIQGGNLQQKINQVGTLSQKQTVRITKQIISALQYLHSKHIIHRDLKPGNILLDANGTVKIIDFGFASKKQFQIERKHSLCGSPQFVAPEVLACALKIPNSYPGYSLEVDIWSVGVLIYYLLTGKLPFNGKTNSIIYKEIIKAKPKFSDNKLSKNAISFLTDIFQPNPEKRIKLFQIRKHPFLNIQQPKVQRRHHIPFQNLSDKSDSQISNLSGPYLSKFSERSLKKMLSVQSIKKKLQNNLSNPCLQDLSTQTKPLLEKRKTLTDLTAASRTTDFSITCRSPIFFSQQAVFLTQLRKDKICLYTLSNGDIGTYERNCKYQMLFSFQGNQIMNIQNDSFCPIFFPQRSKQNLCPHAQILLQYLDQQHYFSNQQLIASSYIYVKKFYDIKNQNSYLIKLSNNSYQLMNYLTNNSLIKFPNKNEVLYIICENNKIKSKRYISIFKLCQQPEIMRMNQILNQAINKISSQQKK